MKTGQFNCDEARKRLIELAYDEFETDGNRADLERHVNECAGCREALGELSWTRDLVDKVAASRTGDRRSVHAVQVQREVARRAELGHRRWRRLAGMASAAALLVCFWSLSRLRVEVHSSHLVFAWGEAAEANERYRVAEPDEPAAVSNPQSLQDSLAAHQRRLVEINRLLDLMVTELNRNSARIETTAAVFTRRIDTVERQNNERWRAVGRGFHDWYLKHALAQASLPSGDF